MLLKVSSLALLLGAAPAVHAWGAAGHEIVATIAQIFLTPTSRASLCAILPSSAECHLAPVASWADRVRNPYTGPLHYINGIDDWPADHCLFGEHGWTDENRNVWVGLVNSTRNVIWADGQERDFALRYLVHFMGDMHMPLHLVGRDRGGNQDAVRWDHRITNLHSVWDNLLLAKAVRTLTNYTEPLPSKTIESALRGAIYDSYVRFIVWEGVLGWWKDEYLNWASCPSDEPEIDLGLASLPFSEELDMKMQVQHPAQLAYTYRNENEHTLLAEEPLFGLLPPASHSTRAVNAPLSLPLCPAAWSTPIHALNCGNNTLIWPKSFSEMPPSTGTPEHIPAKDLEQLDTDEYAGKVRRSLVLEKVLAMAGVRLAGVLNAALDPEFGAREGEVRAGLR